MNQPTQRKLILIGAGVLVVAIVIVIVAISANLGKQEVSNDNRSTDTNSGEVLSNPTGKTPEIYSDADPINTITYLGTGDLLANGMTREQLDNMKLAVVKYSETLPSPVKRFSITAGSVKSTTLRDAGASGRASVSFQAEVNQKDKFVARVEYVDLSQIQMFLSTSEGKQVFDSGIVSTPVRTEDFIDGPDHL